MGNLSDKVDEPLTKLKSNKKKRRKRKPSRELSGKRRTVKKYGVSMRGKEASAGKDGALVPKSAAGPQDTDREDFEIRSAKRDEERVRRREQRRRKVRRQKIIIAVSAVAIVAAAVLVTVFTRPSVRLSLSLSKGDKCAERNDYDGAQSAYEKALEIAPDSITVYRRMADNYLAQRRLTETEQILYKGWEQTQDEDLLHYYCVEVHNEAVREINEGSCTLATVDKGIQVLELEADNADAVSLLEACYERLFRVSAEEDVCTMFFDEDISEDTCSYAEYEQLVRRLLAVYEGNRTDVLKALLVRYALIDMPYVRISMPHVVQYAALLTDVNSSVQDHGIMETLACLERAQEVCGYFETAFTEFDAGDFAYARTLIVEESYQQIRDSFINEASGYWEGSVYIPVNRELLVLHREDDRVRFYFPDEEEYENRKGIITVWGSKQEDDGIQRSAVSYEPVDKADSHMEYTVQYLYSNVKIDGQYVPQMNYRFDTKITTQDGITTNAVGDWGGEHEWEIDY